MKPRQVDLKRAVSTAYYADPVTRFTKPEVALLIAQAERAIRSLSQASNQDKTAFAELVLLSQRKA